ncbi:Piso0_001838 [Millerozyma farinosa CBS 7064]|uniref:Valine--tRNA ligase, mitochondrial n=1 Tax=Pichia sorbitophila (strain ATCC MYA-4447 / BCRC 22081 / CBS 7064 / NBRC 10061 / NRRL Y-12695) TaxID=559304 RepID=G8YLV6_PICSO|nr:Piso0_001838 [Millerozyma farinosa CBS 7064]
MLFRQAFKRSLRSQIYRPCISQSRYFWVSMASNAEIKPSSAEQATNPSEGQAPVKKEKTAKEIEKEKKKAEKLAKFNAKKAKQAEDAKKKSSEPKKPKKEKQAREPAAEIKDETVPGEKKILVSLDDAAFKAYNPKFVESSWYDWWDKSGLFQPSFTESGEVKPQGLFSIPAPPPNVTGSLHIGHALTISIQDTLVRYNRMKGKTTLFLPGFDHAGIATQSIVEKQIWKNEKKTRYDYGREAFVEKVWEWKEEYHKKIKNQVKKLGASYDWTREAFTLNPDLSEAVTEAFVRLHEDGTIYREARLVNWCSKLKTAISNLEVTNKTIPGRTLIAVPDYDDKIEFGVITSFSYPVENSDEKITVATTRPETLFGDTAVAVHPNDPRYKHLHGKYVIHPFLERKLPIITDSEAVDMEFGTGAVKITPAHDQNDYNTGKRNNLEFINILTDDGLLNENCGKEWEGTKRFDARGMVIEKLKEKGLFVEQKDNEMTIPICSRSGDVIEPLLKPQWWVNQKEMARDAIKAVKDGKITIKPKSSESEYFHWLENIQDWCISRQLWWGHRCPVYFAEIEGESNDHLDNNYWFSGRTYEEALEKAQKKLGDKKFVLMQDEDVLDTWFSSGLWPISTLGWPKKTKDLETFAPMSLLETGWDILFFWVSRMILLGLKLTGEIPFNEVFCHSLVRDAQGRKMSKSLGNVIDPLDVISGIPLEGLHEKLKVGNLDPSEFERAKEGQRISYPNGIPECGCDAMRFALCAYSTGARDINLDILRVEGYRKFCNKIYQATKFVLMRLGSDFKPSEEHASGNKSLVERWILHKLSDTADSMNKHLDNREFSEAANSIYTFWYDLCDVYIENSKYLIQDGTPEQKTSAQNTLYTCIDGALRMIHPFMPFVTEEMWQRLPRRSSESAKSIIVAEYPQFSKEFNDPDAVAAYELVLEITKSTRSVLAQYNILKNGQVFVESSSPEVYRIVSEQQDSIVSLIKGVNKITVVSSGSDVPAGCALQSVNPQCTVHVLIKGQIDIDAEITKVTKKLAQMKDLSAKLNDSISKFTEKTSEHAKEAALKRADTFKAEIEGYEQTISVLENLKI